MMAINDTPKEKPTGGCSPAAGAINNVDFPTAQPEGKAFATLRAAFALRGHALHRTDPTDGPVSYWAERWGLVRHLPTIDAARRFLEQIGGQL